MDLGRGDPFTLTALSTGAHAGTHLEGPAHFLAGGATVDELPLEAVLGPCRVLDLGRVAVLDEVHLRPHHIRRGERILLKTLNSSRPWATLPFDPGFVALTPAAARFLAERGVRLLGVDGPSVGGPQDGAEVHRVLLGAGVWLLEALDLSQAAAGRYDLACLPLRLQGAEAAPARVALRTR
jgi:arylformamidase